MSFVLKMVARELRASWRRLLFFFICVAIGVAAIVTLRSIIQSLRAGLVREARATIASDVLVQSSRPWTPEILAELEQQLATAPIEDRTESIETATMVRAESGNAVLGNTVHSGTPKHSQLGRECRQNAAQSHPS